MCCNTFRLGTLILELVSVLLTAIVCEISGSRPPSSVGERKYSLFNGSFFGGKQEWEYEVGS